MRELTGTWRLVRLAFRRDRVKLSVTIAAIALFIPLLILGVSDIFASDKEMREGIAFLAANPAMRLFGLPTGAEFGNLLMLRMFTMLAITVALVSTFTVIRHTRQNEELGRSELVESLVVGRHAKLVAALIVAVLINLVIIGITFIGLMSSDNLPVQGSLAMAVGLGCIGIVFAGVAAIAAQLTQTSRSANNIAAVSVVVAFLLSGVASVLGQLQPNGMEVDPIWLIWLSPIGWAQLMQPFANEQWAMIGVFGLFFVVCFAVATLLANKRDIGRSIFAARLGRASAKSSLLSASGLTWRLQKGVFIGWAIGLGLLGAIYGVIAQDVEELLGQAEGIAEVFIGATGSDEIILAFFGAIISMIGLLTLVYAVQITLRLKAEEDRALEALLSGSLSRFRWAASYIIFVILTVTFLLVLAAFAAGLTAELLLAEQIDVLWPVVVGALTQIPAIMTLVGFALVVFAFLPRFASGLTWTAVSLSIVFGPLFSSMLGLPEAFSNISPLTHTPSVPPLENIEALPLLVLSGIAMLLCTVGLVAFRHRDITTT